MATTDDNKRCVGRIRPLTWPLEAKMTLLRPLSAIFGHFWGVPGGCLGFSWLYSLVTSIPCLSYPKNGLPLPDPNRLSQADLDQATAGGFSGSLGMGWM